MYSRHILTTLLIVFKSFVADAMDVKQPLLLYPFVGCANDSTSVVKPLALSELHSGIPSGTPHAVRCAFVCRMYEGCIGFNHRWLGNDGQCELFTSPPMYCRNDSSCQFYQATEYTTQCRLLVDVHHCEYSGGSLNITCPRNTTISIVYANYGRTSPYICTAEGYLSNTSCISAGSYNYVKQRCQGNRTCSVQVSNSVYGDPCYGTTKYMYITYYCAKAE